MNTDKAKIAVEILKAMYEHNSQSYASVGRTDVGPEPLTVNEATSDFKFIYDSLQG